MKTKLVLATETKDMDFWTELPFVPRINEWFNVQDILQVKELEDLRNQSRCWSGEKGVIQSVEYHHAAIDGYFVEVVIWCED